MFSFPTRMGEVMALYNQNPSKYHRIQEGSTDMLVGEDNLPIRPNPESSSKNEEITRVCVLTALAIAADDGDELSVIIGCPFEEYNKVESRNKYRDEIIPTGKHKVTIDGVEKNFGIGKRTTAPESSGITRIAPELFDGETAIIDIGGLNVSAVQVSAANLVLDTALTQIHGSIDLFSRIADRLYGHNQKVFKNLREDQIKRFLELNNVKDDIEATYKMNSVVDEFLQDIIVKIKNNKSTQYPDGTSKWDNLLSLDRIVWMGGTSVLLEDRINNLVVDGEDVGYMSYVYKSEVEGDINQYGNALGFLIKFRKALGL